jgi:hypothetical protein
MTKMTDDTIGIDISKATLDIHRLSDGKMMSFSNCTAGFKALSKFCAQTTVTRVVYEATGAYHSGLERALGAHLPLVKVNPLQARRFAQAQGVRAKTDAVDAKILAIMGDAFALEPDEPAAKIQHDVIMTPNGTNYFDHFQAEPTEDEPISIGGMTKLEDVYAYDPVPEELTPDEVKYIFFGNFLSFKYNFLRKFIEFCVFN